jgi:hypothetical protein
MDAVVRVLIWLVVLWLILRLVQGRDVALAALAVHGGGQTAQAASFPTKEECVAGSRTFPNRAAVWRHINGVRDWADAKRRIVDTYTPVKKSAAATGVLEHLPSVEHRIAAARNGKAALERTLRWLYDTHKVGVFVRVRDGRIVEYCPFNNPAYRNAMAGALAKDRGIPKLARAMADRPVMWCQYWPQDAGHWKGGERLPAYYNEFRWWWEEAARSRRLADCDFFVNYKDQLVAPEPGRSSYPHLPAEAQALTTRPPGAFVPILSQSTAPGFQDVPFVTADDITRVSERSFPSTCFDHYHGLDKRPLVPWEDRDPRALFRGSATGCGTTPATNPRLGVVALSRDPKVAPLLDVGLTGRRSTQKHYYAEGRAQPRPKKTKISGRVPFGDHGKYRVLLDLDGNVLAYRLSALFAFGSVVVRTASRFSPWFADLLVSAGPDANCQVADEVADLAPILERLRDDPARAEKIGAAGRALFDEKLGRDALLDYTEALTRAFSALPN